MGCEFNQLTALDVSKNTTLTHLFCESNQLTALVVSGATALTTLYCFGNQLTALDVSKNAALRTLVVYYNNFTSEDDIIGLNKSNITSLYFNPQNSTSVVLYTDHTIPPKSDPPAVLTSVSPATALTAVFTIGPNPAVKSSAKVSFYRNGAILNNATLSIYDVSGNAVAAVKSGLWDLRDNKGRFVSVGTYLVRGVVKTKGGKSERVSAVVGVR